MIIVTDIHGGRYRLVSVVGLDSFITPLDGKNAGAWVRSTDLTVLTIKEI